MVTNTSEKRVERGVLGAILAAGLGVIAELMFLINQDLAAVSIYGIIFIVLALAGGSLILGVLGGR